MALPPMRRAGSETARKKRKSIRSGSRGSFILQAAQQPGPGVGPDGVSLSDRDPEYMSGLITGEAGKVVQLDQFGRLCVRDGEVLQCFIHCNPVLQRAVDDWAISWQLSPPEPTAVPDSFLASGRLNEDA